MRRIRHSRRCFSRSARVRSRVVTLAADGRSCREIAAMTGMSKATAQRMVQQLRSEITAYRETLAREVMDEALADKAARVRERAALYHAMVAVMENQGPMDAHGRFRSALIGRMLETLRAIAEELGQLPRPEVNVHSQEQRVTFAELVRLSQDTEAIEAEIDRILEEDERRRKALKEKAGRENYT